jgi:uncharacterized surface protein with fasciclin (FAS1) repeats
MKKQLIAAAAAITGLTFAVAPTVDAMGKPGPDDIVTIAVENGNFTTLVAAVGCADPAVGAALTSGDKYTVFAPTDAAFMATLGVDADSVCTIPQDLLTTVLLYHVTEGRRFSNSVVPRNMVPRTIETLSGIPFQVENDLGIIDGNDTTEPSIVAELANINASNGVIHVVDQVLLPINL